MQIYLGPGANFSLFCQKNMKKSGLFFAASVETTQQKINPLNIYRLISFFLSPNMFLQVVVMLGGNKKHGAVFELVVLEDRYLAQTKW